MTTLKSSQFFIPSGNKFSLADEIPFHIQLSGPVSSLQVLYSHLRLEHVDNENSDAPTSPVSFIPLPSPTLNRRGSRSSPPTDHQHLISLSVTLNRQVCVEVKSQVVWKSSVIGEGRVFPLPPPFESVTENLKPSASSSLRSTELDKMGFLDGAGDIKCSPDVKFGKFNAGKIKIDVSLTSIYLCDANFDIGFFDFANFPYSTW